MGHILGYEWNRVKSVITGAQVNFYVPIVLMKVHATTFTEPHVHTNIKMYMT